ncbi:DUF421 domain-containing protein [Pseudalkalibacillus salsuginis]|uniref:DUF421 domain-containing protein n=1 Tax=Pseudalkalibacillus salsuginis TaxID=2910972 RepID=UPI001F2A4DE6|nr:DUF421 domain-containing protein [Pseudalkalibacillus salsuginis]MCF6409877.1 DUF421 domain-containing protein [Pseudalkalibacillus salsuginis]
MDLDWIWKAVLIILFGTLLLRIAGRKSISQMTLAQTVIMVGIGSLLIQPVAGKNIWTTFLVGTILVLTLVVMEFIQLKFNPAEKLITGKSKIVIENGTLNESNLKKMRLTVDQLEMKLRQQNVTAIEDVKWATLEPNGQVGFMLKNVAQPVTKKEFQQLKQDIGDLKRMLNPNTAINQPQAQENQTKDLFSEVENNTSPSPKHLQ